MARWKQVTAVNLIAGQGSEDAEIIALSNELASLRDEPAAATVKRLLREVLPQKIAELRRARQEQKRSA